MRVVYNTRANKFEVHRGILFHQYWEDDYSKGGYWWTAFPEHATKFNTKYEAMMAYNHSRKKEKPLPHYIFINWFL